MACKSSWYHEDWRSYGNVLSNLNGEVRPSCCTVRYHPNINFFQRVFSTCIKSFKYQRVFFALTSFLVLRYILIYHCCCFNVFEFCFCKFIFSVFLISLLLLFVCLFLFLLIFSFSRFVFVNFTQFFSFFHFSFLLILF